ncbi:hypothetical protein [Sulfitobacter dubius]|uniref:hypothetical protein n=1 Tax=Sulfitobacter dubius TaxID=218673 RepID=UPI0022AE9ABD|nr:hypothetical protein [Sulfitobacter dubius]MCZ4366646.1 hypothetical protein [Sulfitobacter dubius]
MKERDIQKKILARLSQEYHKRGLFWTRDVGQFISVAEIAKAIKAIMGGASPIETLRKLRRLSIGLVGEPDISGCLDGRWIGIEVKTATGRQRPDQAKFQKAIEARGGIYIIARSPDDAITQIEMLLRDAA